MKRIFLHGLFAISLWQLLCRKTTMDYNQFFSRKFAQFGIIGVLWPKITIFIIVPTQFSSLIWNFSLKMNSSQKCRIRKFTTLKLDQNEVHFQILHFSTGIIFDKILQLSDENWVRKMINIVIFGHRTPIIPNCASLGEKNR